MKRIFELLKIAVLTIIFIIGITACNHCLEKENDINKTKFEIGVVNEVKDSPCWLDVAIVDNKKKNYSFSHCYCGLGDDLDLKEGDSLVKEIGEVSFYNIRTQSDITFNCCSH